MKKKKLNTNKGILFWITGLSGSGKTSIAKKISREISNNYGPTIVISGDDLRKIFILDKYDYKSRLYNMKKFTQFSKFITDQKINVIFAIVGLIEKPRVWSRKNIDNYIEIYIKSDLKKIIKANKKKLYNKKNQREIVGINIKPEFPKKYDIIIKNDFKKSLDELAKTLLRKINNYV